MQRSWLRWLCCPLCSGPLSILAPDRLTAGHGYYILTCDCSEYPVVAGIPIFKKGVIGTEGQPASEVLALLKAGRHREALRALIAPFSPTLAPAWMRRLPAVRGIGRLTRGVHRWSLHGWRVEELRERLTACDLFDLYFRRAGREAVYEYFALRPGQPHYLVALSLASLIRRPTHPVLDLACGFGHVTRSLVRRAQGQPVIGVDRSFYVLYGAKHWLAPEAEYVCCEADAALPFVEGAFSAVFCSDAFEHFANKALCLRELTRLTQAEGLILLVGLQTGPIGPPHGPSVLLPPEGVRRLVAGIPHRLVADRDVLARYLQRQGPPLARSAELGALVTGGYLSVVISHRREVFQDYGPFADWPHAEGHLGLNPLYVAVGGEGRVHLRRMFPAWRYEAEKAEAEAYLPEAVTVGADVLADLARGRRTPAVDHLIAQGVVMGMPDQYGAPSTARPELALGALGVSAANRADTDSVG